MQNGRPKAPILLINTKSIKSILTCIPELYASKIYTAKPKIHIPSTGLKNSTNLFASNSSKDVMEGENPLMRLIRVDKKNQILGIHISFVGKKIRSIND